MLVLRYLKSGSAVAEMLKVELDDLSLVLRYLLKRNEHMFTDFIENRINIGNHYIHQLLNG
jgi:hypothetical protein